MSTDEGTRLVQLYGEALEKAAQGELAGAGGLLRRVAAYSPSLPEPIMALGALALRGGNATPALRFLARALGVDPLNPHGLYNQALALEALGREPDATANLRRALASAPGFAAVQGALGRAELRSSNVAPAALRLRRAIASTPRDPELHIDLGHALRAAGQHLAAIARYREGARLATDAAGPLINLGAGLVEAGHLAEAATICRRALALAPASADAFYNMAKAEVGGARCGSLVRALAIDSRFAAAHLDLGVCRHAQDRLPDALAHYRTAAALDPGLAKAPHNAGALLMQRGLTLQAEPLFRRSVVLDPVSPALMSDLLFCLCFLETPDLDAVFAEHRRFNRRFACKGTAPSAFSNGRDPDRVLRVGYVSSNLHRHPVGHALLGLFEHRDRREIEITAYAGPSPVDEMTCRLRMSADRWIDTDRMPDEVLAATVRQHEIDILVDCIGHLPQGRLLTFARRAAPIQIGFPVYPNTTGLTEMDYRIADAEVAPPSTDRHHVERLIRLPDVYACYRPAADDIIPPALPPVERAGVFTFASFNNPAKLGDAVLSAWAKILRDAPNARLILKWRGLDASSAPVVELRRLGVAPERIVIAGWAANAYSPYLDVDCCLDPFVNGGNTTYDALWMGVPVLTLRGRHLFARVGASLLAQIGLRELAVDDVGAYIRTAIALAGDRDRLRRIRHHLRERVAASPLTDDRRYAGHVGSAYRAVWRRWCDGLAPAALTVGTDGGIAWSPTNAPVRS